MKMMRYERVRVDIYMRNRENIQMLYENKTLLKEAPIGVRTARTCTREEGGLRVTVSYRCSRVISACTMGELCMCRSSPHESQHVFY